MTNYNVIIPQDAPTVETITYHTKVQSYEVILSNEVKVVAGVWEAREGVRVMLVKHLYDENYGTVYVEKENNQPYEVEGYLVELALVASLVLGTTHFEWNGIHRLDCYRSEDYPNHTLQVADGRCTLHPTTGHVFVLSKNESEYLAVESGSLIERLNQYRRLKISVAIPKGLLVRAQVDGRWQYFDLSTARQAEVYKTNKEFADTVDWILSIE